jgi:hypothetical protein
MKSRKLTTKCKQHWNNPWQQDERRKKNALINFFVIPQSDQIIILTAEL